MQHTQTIADSKAVQICNMRNNKTLNLPECKLFARHHALLVSMDDYGLKPKPQELFYVARRLSLNAIRRLVESSADIHQTNKDGDTPLLLASCKNRIYVVEYLLAKGADINHKDRLNL